MLGGQPAISFDRNNHISLGENSSTKIAPAKQAKRVEAICMWSTIKYKTQLALESALIIFCVALVPCTSPINLWNSSGNVKCSK